MKNNNKIADKVLVGITGKTNKDWKEKFKEIEKFKITRTALFLELFKKKQREEIYKALLKSSIKEIPLIHIRNDMSRSELKFLCEKYNNPCLTIHENSFRYLKKWSGYYQNLFLEMNTDNFVSRRTKLRKIGGFCVDLAHFKVAEEKWSEEFEYPIRRRKNPKHFDCNLLSGYSYENNTDVHSVKNKNEFDYVKTLPRFVFSN
ncbi:MAG TPA: hypothetical protein ENG89_00545, partial [Candidatus Moranbacteria bacterium]|nr:hypothetical protein [Candidatus Moranbacteria bacterium]